MCKAVEYWMKLYIACIVKGGLITVIASFLLFQCSDLEDKNLVIGNVIISNNMLAFDDTVATGGEYTISLNQNPAAGKIVQITLKSENDALQISPDVVNFTETTGKAPQTITVTRKAGASDMIPADITRVINHTIASNVDSDPNITTFQDGSMVHVTVRSTVSQVILTENALAFDDTAGSTGGAYTISLSQDPAVNKTVRITLTSNNDILQISPLFVSFTKITGRVPQTITVTRKAGVSDMIVKDVTRVINHTIALDADSDPNITAFQDGSTVHVTVRSTVPKVIISEDVLAFDDTASSTGVEYTISLSQDLAANKTVQITLTSVNDILQISPDVVNFTETTGKAPQTITITRKAGASDMIPADITRVINHTIALDADSDPNITFQDGSTVHVIVRSTFLVDFDSNGLIEIRNAIEFNNMRHDLAGTSYKTSANDVGDSRGCPASGCKGYELKANIDLLSLLDTGGMNGEIDETTVGIDTNADGDTMDNSVSDGFDKQARVIDTNKDTSWVPIGVSSTPFIGIFDGDHHTIANLWVNGAFSRAGLFGTVSGTVEIRNVGVISGSVHSSGSSSGGLVGFSDSSLTITNSYFSGSGGISSSSISAPTTSGSHSGGLVGFSDGSLTIINSYFSGSGGIFSSFSSTSGSVTSTSHSGGLVGFSNDSLRIINSYFSGSGKISSSASSVSFASASLSGGFVGFSDGSLTIMNSYFSSSGEVSSFASSSAPALISLSGGLIGDFLDASASTITNSYWNIDALQSVKGSDQSPKRVQGEVEMGDSIALMGESGTVEVAGTTGLTLMQLQATSGMHPDGLLSPTSGIGDAWNLIDMQLPAIKRCVSPITATGVCASYGALLAGQR